MFDQLYKAQRARERHLNAPLVDERIRYLSHWAAQGSVRSSLRVRAQDLLTTIEYLDVEAAGQISEKQIINAADQWANKPRDIRDRALIMLFAVYRLRVSEVRTLTVADLDWEKSSVVLKSSIVLL